MDYEIDDWWVSMKRIDGHVFVKMTKPANVNFLRNQLQ